MIEDEQLIKTFAFFFVLFFTFEGKYIQDGNVVWSKLTVERADIVIRPGKSPETLFNSAISLASY